MMRFILLLCLGISHFLEGKTPRHLWLDSPSYIGGAGFFHNFNIVLGCLDLYDTKDFVSLTIDFGNQGLYYEPTFGSNWWSYYFEKIHYPAKKPPSKAPLLKKFGDREKGDLGNYVHFFMERQRANQLISSYIQVKKEITQEVQSFYEKNLKDSFIIGAHYRGTDKWAEAQWVGQEELIQAIDKEMQNHPDAKIFLATDELACLHKLSALYKERLVFIDANRYENVPIHYSCEHHYQMGKEALIDALLLSKCDVLIRTNSNLSAVAAFFNPKMPVINLNRVNDTLYQGIIKKGKLSELQILSSKK